MKKTTAILLVLVLVGALVAGIGLAPLIKEALIPTTGEVENIDFTKTWVANNTDVTTINWGVIPNATETTLADLINLTNTGNTALTFTLSLDNPSVNILDSTLTWNYTGTLQPAGYSIVQLTLNITCSTPAFSFNTIITAST